MKCVGEMTLIELEHIALDMEFNYDILTDEELDLYDEIIDELELRGYDNLEEIQNYRDTYLHLRAIHNED